MQAWCPSRSCPPTTRQSGAFQETEGGSSPVQRWIQDDQISRILMILTCIKGNSSDWPMNRRKPGFVEKTVDSLILIEISFFLKHYKIGRLHHLSKLRSTTIWSPFSFPGLTIPLSFCIVSAPPCFGDSLYQQH